MKTMEFCSGSMLHGFQGNPWNFPHAFSMVFPWFSHAFSTREKSERTELLMCFYLDMCFINLHYYTCEIKDKWSVNMFLE